ncbi:MAG TPA: histidine kinase [Vicinamibacterales bacterium]|nr:histidine kinase [Vicinamibacterales bacterium]
MPLAGERRRLLLYLLAWGLVGVGLALLMRVWLEVAWAAALAFGLPLGLLAAPMSSSGWYLCRAMPLSRTSAPRLVTTALAAALVTAALWAAAGQLWASALAPVGFALGRTPPAALVSLLVGLGALGYLLSLTVQYLIQGVQDTAQAARRVLESQVAARDAELRALRAQVDPHFLFNALNSIAGLIGPSPAKARLMCQMLGDFLRDSLVLGRADRIPLGREVALAEQYLQIEQVRFGSRLVVRSELAPDVIDTPVPPLLLQPLVENAVGHGVSTCVDGGAIDVRASRAGRHVLVVVTNPRDIDGVRRGTGFGLDIVRRRLAAAFGDRASLAIEAAADAYRVTVSLPMESPEP